MISIDNKEINNYTITVRADPFSGIINGKFVKTKAIYISISYKKYFIDIETTYPMDWLNELNIGKKVNFRDYISEIEFINDGFLYNWINKIDDSVIEKMDNNKYRLSIIAHENLIFKLDEIIDIR